MGDSMTRKKRNPYGAIHRSGWSNIVRSDAVYISFYCRGTGEHPHGKWRIGSIYADVHNGEVVWHESSSGYADAERDVLFRTNPRLTQYMVGNEWVAITDASDSDVYNDPSFRVSWQLKCGECGFTKKIARRREIFPLLNALAGLRGPDNILEIPIREFSRRVDVQTADSTYTE